MESNKNYMSLLIKIAKNCCLLSIYYMPGNMLGVLVKFSCSYLQEAHGRGTFIILPQVRILAINLSIMIKITSLNK